MKKNIKSQWYSIILLINSLFHFLCMKKKYQNNETKKYEQYDNKPTIILHWQTYYKLDLINSMKSILNKVNLLLFTKL